MTSKNVEKKSTKSTASKSKKAIKGIDKSTKKGLNTVKTTKTLTDPVKSVETNAEQSKKKESFFIKNKYDLIGWILILIMVFGYLFSPRYYSVTTARYGKGTEKDNKNVEIALGTENTEERFLTYFQWYNVLHELGHGLIVYNGDVKISNAEEEQLVNEFAVAYWMYYGEEEKIELLQEIVDYATQHIDGPELGNLTYLEYANKHWGESDFMAFNGYGWFQFTSTKEALKNKKTLEEVLKEMKVKDFKITEKKLLEYPNINEEVSTQIINDAVDNIRSWGLKYPDVCHNYDNNPNNNYSAAIKKIFGFIDFYDIWYRLR